MSTGKCFGWGILGGLIAGAAVVGIAELVKKMQHEDKRVKLPWVLKFQTNEEKPSSVFVWAEFTKSKGAKKVSLHMQPFQAGVATPCNTFASQMMLPVQLMPLSNVQITKPVKLWKIAPGQNSADSEIVNGQVTLMGGVITFSLPNGGGAWAQGGGMGLAEPLDIEYASGA